MSSTRYNPTEASAPEASSYFDDEEILRGDDAVLEEVDDFGAVQQQEHLVTWEVEGAFDEKGNVRKKNDLRRDPPLLKVRDAEGVEVEVLLTKEFSRMLYQALEAVYKGYFGINTKRNSLYSRGWQGIMEELRKRKIAFAILFILIVFAFVYPHWGSL